jgi:hypothetical protein
MVTPLRDILKGAVKAWGLEPAARLADVRSAWPRIVGAALAATSAPLAIRGTRLDVCVTHPAAGHEIRLRTLEIAGAVNRALGEEAVNRIRVVTRRRLPRPAAPARRRHGDARRARTATRG